jgi:predicted nucleotidyltransferase
LFNRMSINYSAATMAIIDALGQDPETKHYVRAIAEKAKVSVGAASMILHELEGSGILTMEQTGNMKFYQYNLSNPVARQLKVLFNTSRLKLLADMLMEAAERVVLFGSTAEGTDARDSDVDLFILTQDEAGTKQILDQFRRKHPISRSLSPIIMNATGFSKLRRQDPSLYENILRGRVLWERG